jgi:hypothetical protein
VAGVLGAAWRSESFRFSTDPQLVGKVTDVVGLYLNPRALNRPGKSGDSEPWEGWSHARRYAQAVPACAEGAGGADGRRDPGRSGVGVGGDDSGGWPLRWGGKPR